ncbi:MAG: EAL domain-containing protein [Vulcanimicrobiaceae bacterium]
MKSAKAGTTAPPQGAALPISVLEQFARVAACLFEVPIALISLREASGSEAAAASCGLNEGCRPVVARQCASAAGRDGTASLALAENDAPIRAGAAAALYGADRARLGTLCLFDTNAHEFSPAQLELLAEVAELVAAHLGQRDEALEAKGRLAALMAASPDAIVFTRRDRTIEGWNEGAARLFGWSREELMGRMYALAPPDQSDELERWRRLNLEAGETFHGFETQRLTCDGGLIDVAVSAGPVRNAAGNIAGTVAVMEDLTERKRLREVELRRLKVLELAAHDAPLTNILDHLVESVEFGIPGGICTILRCRGNALEHAASGPALPPIWIEAIKQARIGPSEGSCGSAAFFGETVIVDDIASDPRWETPRPLALELGLRACWSAPIVNAQGIVHGTLAVYSNQPRVPTDGQLRIMHEAAHLASIVIEGQLTRDRLEDLALRDGLTGLPNRALFEDRLHQAIAAAKRSDKKVFLGLLDLDRFKVVNDNFGHVVSDQLLVEVAARLRQAVRAGDTVARMGGDEFLFVLTDIDDRKHAESIARRILAELDRGFSLSGNELFVRASLGFTAYPDDATDPAQLLRLADGVMYEVKACGTGVGFHEGRPDEEKLRALPMEAAINRAQERHEFVLCYQPQVDRDNRIRAAEAQLYWQHPEHGLLPRERFMEVAEEAGLAVTIGAWMLREACRFAKSWKTAGGAGCVAVNLSARQYRDRDFVALVVGAIADAGIVPAQLCLEITETTAGRSSDGIAASLAELRSYGVRTIVDDFGTGCSSLRHLRSLPIDGVKIDRSFLSAAGTGNPLDDGAFFEALVGVGKALHLEVAAEGVETSAQLTLLFGAGCDVAQGTVYAPPMPEETFMSWSPQQEPVRPHLGPRHDRNTERDAIARLRRSLAEKSAAPMARETRIP